MILSKKEILEEIKKGKLGIRPFEESKVGECSVDLSLGNEFRVLKKQTKPINITENSFLNEKQTKRIVLKKNERRTLKPNELVLGITKETIRMPPYLCGWIQGRSRFARLGLMVHVSSSLIQPGVENKQVLEIINLSPSKLTVSEGLSVCQVVFERLSSPQQHRGVFARQFKV
jgi:dCTP deaminase